MFLASILYVTVGNLAELWALICLWRYRVFPHWFQKNIGVLSWNILWPHPLISTFITSLSRALVNTVMKIPFP